MTLLFYYLAPLQNDTVVKSRCMQFNFGGKGEATCLIRKEGKEEWEKIRCTLRLYVSKMN